MDDSPLESMRNLDCLFIDGTGTNEIAKDFESFLDKGSSNQMAGSCNRMQSGLRCAHDHAGYRTAAFRNVIANADGSKRLMADIEFKTKLQAEAHIDELAETSNRGAHIAMDI